MTTSEPPGAGGRSGLPPAPAGYQAKVEIGPSTTGLHERDSL